MGALANFVGKAAGSKKSNLEDFLSRFGSSSAAYVNTIDPQTTFEVQFEFFPHANATKDQKKEKKGMLSKIGDAALNAANNALDNLTGGLVGAMKKSKVEINKLHDQYANRGQHTFMNYLAPANLLVETKKGEAIRDALVMNLGIYVQDITVPKLQTLGGEVIDINYIGRTAMVGTCVVPENNDLAFSILNTKVPLMERIFYPWMREVTLPYWSYADQPYTTATITIDFSSHSDFSYVFTGARPKVIETRQPNQINDASMTRQVVFEFDCMFVTSKLKVSDTTRNKVKDTLKNLAGATGKLMSF